MGLIWILAPPPSGNCDAKTCSSTDYIWRDYLDEVCSMVYSRHNNAITVIFINDNYTVSISIKDDKYECRTATNTNRPNFYPKEAKKFLIPSQFKQIILKSSGKQSSISEAFKALIQSNLSSSAS